MNVDASNSFLTICLPLWNRRRRDASQEIHDLALVAFDGPRAPVQLPEIRSDVPEIDAALHLDVAAELRHAQRKLLPLPLLAFLKHLLHAADERGGIDVLSGTGQHRLRRRR